jgi:hypothetical protein
MAYDNPTVQEFKDYFVRDFPFGTDPNLSVLDADISKAMVQTRVSINQALFPTQEAYGIGYNLLTAHNMVINIRASSQGVNGQFSWLQNSKSVGNVNEAFTIPQRMIDNPYWAFFSKTNYGIQYFEQILPQLTGAGFTAYGPARAL